MTTKEIQHKIATTYIEKNHNPVCTNFQGAGYAECDVITVSQSELVYEFEVKISRSDFLRDSKKIFKHRYLKESYDTTKLKKYHTRKVNNVPNYFTYVCPTGLIKGSEVPIYAGLMYINEVGWLETIKKAPRIHKQCADLKLFKRIARTLTERAFYGMALRTYQFKKSR